MPRYEKGTGLSKMVWEIEVDGCFFHIRYGKARAKQLDTYKREHHTPELAREAAEDMIAQRVKDGYRQASDEPLVSAQPPPSELEQQFRDSPDDDAIYLVFADWLQAQDHPRGRLMAIHQRLAHAPESERTTLFGDELALLWQHRDRLLGRLATWSERQLDARWRRGYLDDVHLSGDRDNERTGIHALGALCELPDAHFVRSVRLGIPYRGDEAVFDEFVEQLAANARYLPRLVRIFVGDFQYPDETEMSWAQLGELQALYAAYPKLEQLIVQGGDFKLGTLALPALRHLEVRTGGLSGENFKSITEAALPALETLIVWIGDENFGAAVELGDLDPIFDGRAWPQLRHLGVCNAAYADRICDALVRSRIAPRLETLDLSLGTMSDEGAEQLASGSFPSLKKIDVSANYLTEAGLDRLRSLGLEVVSTSQKRDDDADDRYVSVSE